MMIASAFTVSDWLAIIGIVIATTIPATIAALSAARRSGKVAEKADAAWKRIDDTNVRIDDINRNVGIVLTALLTSPGRARLERAIHSNRDDESIGGGR